MADIFSDIVARILPRLGQEAAEEGGIRSWLDGGIYNISPLSNDKEIIISDFNLENLVKYWSFDFERFSISSYESFCSAFKESQSFKLSGWPIVKMYYSGYFAAHAIMRGLGASIVKLDNDHVSKIKDLMLFVHGSDLNISAGMYSFEIIKERPSKIKIRPYKDSGGVHESFWKKFSNFLEEISDEALKKNEANARNFVSGISEITRVMKRDQSKKAVWISSVRNEINYRHEYDSWLPNSHKKRIHEIINKNHFDKSSDINLQINLNNNEIKSIIENSRYLASLNKEIGDYIALISKKPNSFGSKWRKVKTIIQ